MLELNWNIIWTVVNMIVLYLLMKRFLFKPVNAMMDKRAEMVRREMEEAQEKNAQAQQLQAQYTQMLNEAKNESAAIINRAKERGQAEYDKLIQTAKEDAAALLQNAQKIIEIEKSKATADLREQIADIALAATFQVVQGMDQDDSKKIIDSFLAEVGGAS